MIADLRHDHTQADLSPELRCALDYALKLTTTPHSITESDIQSLKAAGFDDLAIHDICAITSYFAFVNRIADGLGVELEADFD